MDETQNWPEIVAEKERKIAELELQNQWLLEQLKLSKQRQYGTSSEKNLDGGEQLSIFNEGEATADPTAAEPALEQIIPEHKRRKQKGKREADFSGLPVEQVVHELSEAERVCPDCGGLLHACGHEVYRREVTVVPPQFKVTEHVQTAYSCRNCEEAAKDDPVPMMKSAVPARQRRRLAEPAGLHRPPEICPRPAAVSSGAGIQSLGPEPFAPDHGQLDDLRQRKLSAANL